MATSNIDSSIPLQVQTPDTFGKLSQILGIRQQQQALQTGQYTQESAQANAQQAMQQNQEFAAARQVANDAVASGKYTKQDGSLDRQAMADDITKVAPTYGQDIANKLIAGASDAISNKRAIQALNGDQQKQLGGFLTSMATSKELTNDGVTEALNTAIDANPSPEYRKLVLSISRHIPAGASPDQLRQVIQGIASGFNQSAQQTPSSVDTGATIQPGATNAYTGAFTPAGGPIHKQTPPMIITDAFGQPRKVTAGGASSSVVPDAAGGAPPTNAAAANAETASKNDQDLYTTTIKPSADKAPVIKNILSNITALADETPTGKYSKQIADAEAALSQRIPGLKSANDSATKRQLLGKYTAQLLLQSYQANGASTDSAKAQVDQAIPDPDHMTSDAIKQASNLIQAQTQLSQARGAVAEKYKAEHGGSTQGLQAVDSQFMQSTDPRAFEYISMSKADRAKFLKDNFKSDAERQDFAGKLSLIDHMGGFNYAK